MDTSTYFTINRVFTRGVVGGGPTQTCGCLVVDLMSHADVLLQMVNVGRVGIHFDRFYLWGTYDKKMN